MSDAATAFAKRVVDAINTRDDEARTRVIHPDIEFRSGISPLEGRVYRGYEGLAEWREALDDAFDETHWELEEARDAPGGCLFVLMRASVRGRGSGARVDQLVPQVWRLRDGRVVHNEVFRDRAEALSAAGLEG